ncbi:primary replicative DNA helicase [Nocardioides sp. YR527]|uniref:replicative DNA helicase n=1 Tax=Nocardioides sp. YR527 TaxID=1881028 RepID=UPI00088A4DB3|nr:DnaB-like helicase C-terminal domain-containing protein [Nocardioides sp. YR527]SDL15247.1 primary replicative DNA helicase [Nocardioides sp. YR527]
MTATQNTDAERALLSALLTGRCDMDELGPMLTEADFWNPHHGAVWDACVTAHGRGDRIDPVTLPVEARHKTLLVDLMVSDVLPVQAPRYAAQVADAALRRRLVDAALSIRQRAEDPDAGSGEEAAREAESIVAKAAESAETSDSGVALEEAVDLTLDWIEHPQQTAPTPWPEVNDATNGLRPGQMITVAARPGHGKSLVAANVGMFTAMQGQPVHIASLEMSREEYVSRFLANLAKVSLGNIINRQLSDREWSQISDAAERLRHLPLWIDDRPAQSMTQIRAAARRTQRKFGKPLGLIAIDYAQLVRPADARMPREQQVAQISGTVKLTAKEYACPVLLLAQLNRGNVNRTDKTPMVSDLRESGALEQDSDQVWLLHRPDQYERESDRAGEVDLIVGKNRGGPSGVQVSLSFQGHYGRIASMV